jgi:oxygen-dependent protoporphyrinogen oxidase
MVDAIVVGAGLSGLSCAERLVAAGLDVRVLEARDEPGGNVRTLVRDGYRMERGPHTFMASADDVFAFVEEVSAAHALVGARAAAAVRFIARHGRLHPLFTGPLSFARSRLLGTRGKLALMSEPLRTRRGEPGDTAMAFFERRFGPEAARVLAGSFVSGIYAGDPERLSAPAAFPLFWHFEQRHGGMIRGGARHALARRRREGRRRGGVRRRGLFSLRGGLGTLTRAAGDLLGARLECDAPVRGVSRSGRRWTVEAGGRTYEAGQLVVAVPPGAAAGLLADVDAFLARELEEVVLAPLAVVHAGFARRAPRIPDAFGFLVPREESIRTLGVLFPSRMFDDRAPGDGDLLTGFVGGRKDPGALDLDDAGLRSVVLGDVRRLTGLEAEPDMVQVLRYERAIPQLELGHLERMDRVRAMVGRLPGLRLAGNYLGGVGMKDAVASGFEAAAHIVEQRTGR